MATKTITIDTGEIIYIDANGHPHTAKNAETFTFTLTDGGSTAVSYNMIAAQDFLCDDGSRVHIRLQTDSNNTARKIETLADTQNNTTLYDVGGEIVMVNDACGIEQHWRIAQIKVDDVDTPTALNLTLEDEFGNVMVIPHPAAGGTLTVA